MDQQRRSHFPGQAAAMTRRSSVSKQRRSHLSGHVAWYSGQVAWCINCSSLLRPGGMILRPSGNGASTAYRGLDLKILCLPAEEVPPLRPSGNDQKILCPQAEEVPLLRPGGMVLRPRGNGTSTALHFPGQAAWISRGGHTSQARWQWYIGGTLRPHLSGQMTWYINCSLNWTWMGSLRPCRRVPPPGGELL